MGQFYFRIKGTDAAGAFDTEEERDAALVADSASKDLNTLEYFLGELDEDGDYLTADQGADNGVDYAEPVYPTGFGEYGFDIDAAELAARVAAEALAQEEAEAVVPLEVEAPKADKTDEKF